MTIHPHDGIRVEGDPSLAALLRPAWSTGGLPATLVNADVPADAAALVARCSAFAAALPAGTEGLVVTILHDAPPGIASFASHAANAALWAFTRQAALEWASRRIRVNAIGLGAAPAGPFEATEQSGRAAASMPATPATLEDIGRTVRAMASWPSMTGQVIRLGT